MTTRRDDFKDDAEYIAHENDDPPEELLRRTDKCAERQTGPASRRRELRKLLDPPGRASRPRQP